MALSKKRAPMTKDKEVQRAFDKVYEDINELIDSVNSSANPAEEKLDSEGKVGDMRIHKDVDDNYGLQLRTKEGWASSNPRFGTPIVALTDSTTGTVSNTVNDTASDQRDDIATLAAKINEILDALGKFNIKERTI